MADKKSLFEQKIEDTLINTGIDFKGAILVLGISGGPDSTALLVSLMKLQKTFSFVLKVAYIDHGLREEAKNEEDFVRALSDKFNLAFESVKVDTLEYQKKHKLSQEESARHLRYKALSEMSKKLNSHHILVGHTRDDQLETILMNLMRGTGLEGLTGMNIVAKLPPLLNFDTENEISIIRPMLDISKTEITAYIKEMNLTPLIDESNNSPKYSRNRVRNELIPLLEEIRTGSKDTILRTVKTIRLLTTYLDQTVSESLKQCVRHKTNDRIHLDRQLLATYHPSIQIQIFRSVINRLLESTAGMLAIHWESMQKLTNDGTPGTYLELPNNLYFNITKNDVVLSIGPWLCPLPEISDQIILRNGTTIAGGWLFEATEKKDSIYIEAQKSGAGDKNPVTELNGPLEVNLKVGEMTLAVRKRDVGDKIQIKNGHKKLKSLLNEAEVPKHWRDNIPIVYEKETGNIVWVVGVRQV
tara:strand:- start:9147 stop:10559 length:1413 start_codon:yes stop_codon:yes gene_type:complete